MTSSSSGRAFRLRWDVFLSFRGEDTRECFTKKLHESLKSQGIRAFMDDEGLQRGDHIALRLIEAIDDSAASIVIISPNYADSDWCLKELAKIFERGRLVIPVFYKVDPSHVRKQSGPFEEGFRILEKRFGNQEGKVWREAMSKLGGIAGLLYDDRSTFSLFLNLIITNSCLVPLLKEQK